MNRKGFQLVTALGVLVGFSLICGCAGTGEVLTLRVHVIPDSDPTTVAEEPGQLTVLVQPFDDQRSQRERLGARTHLWGGRTFFNVEEGRAGEVVARVLADYLKQRGWTVGVETLETTQLEAKPDVRISGQVLEFSAKAKSRFGSTLMTASLKVALKAENTANGTVTTINVDDARENSVFWFDPEDLEGLVNQMLKESLENTMGNLKVTDSSLRMK